MFEDEKLKTLHGKAENSAVPRVFVSYSHESDEHTKRCVELTVRLRQDGIEAWIDQFEDSPDVGWARWTQEQLEGACFVLVVCTATYRLRFEGQSAPGTGQGVNWEGFLTQQILYQDDARNRRFIPIQFDDGTTGDVPKVLASATRYRIPEDYPKLLKRLHNQAPVAAVPLGTLKRLTSEALATDIEYTALLEELKGCVVNGLDRADIDRRILIRRRQLRDQLPLNAGSRLADNRYEIIEQIGKGGFATVWKAYDCLHRTIVAIKALHAQFSEDRGHRERFFRGARQMAALRHPGIVEVLSEQHEEDNLYYFVMEYVPGGDLRSRVLSKSWSRLTVVEFLAQIAEALGCAHDHGLIHRDVKPANILMNSGGHPKLTDFDLVRGIDTTHGTRTGALGTYIYAAPECMRDASRVDARCDVFSLGMVGIFMLYGNELPPDAFRNTLAVIESLECERNLKSVLVTACEWEPDRRFGSMKELRSALVGVRNPPRIGKRHVSDPKSATSTHLALRFISGKYAGGEYPIPRTGRIEVGRSSELEMVIVEEMVSRRHAVFESRDWVLTLQDLGSTNGTFVNGERIGTQPRTLREGDRVLIGTSILKVVPESSSPGEVSRPNQVEHRRLQSSSPLSGDLSYFSVAKLLRMASTQDGRNLLQIHTESARAELILHGPYIRRAAIVGEKGLSPIAAVLRVLRWRNGTFEMAMTNTPESDDVQDLTIDLVLSAHEQFVSASSTLPPPAAPLRLATPLKSPLHELDPVELDVLQLALNSPNVERILERCPRPGLEVVTALRTLLDRGYLV